MRSILRPRSRLVRAAIVIAAAAMLLSSLPVGSIASAETGESALTPDARLGTVATTSTEPTPAAAPALLFSTAIRAARTESRAIATSARKSSATSVTRVRRRTFPARGEQAKAANILRGLIAKHPILKGTTVRFGKTPNNAQAVAYYTAGRIVINPNHRASLQRILNHEVWHIIDWRDNGRIDWGENVPPK